MADAAVATETPAPATPAKKPKTSAAGAGAKKPKAKPTHPKTSEMVTNAIKELKERNGSSLQAIKKYIAAQYKVDAERLAPFIRKYLKSAFNLTCDLSLEMFKKSVKSVNKQCLL